MNKRLIVNADDLGITRETNRAIALAHAAGMISSASLLVNLPASEDAVANVISRYPRLGVGLHICLTSGPSVLGPVDVPLLANEDGHFRHGFAGLARLLLSSRRQEALAQVRAEVEAQWQRACSWGVALDHLNSHQHVHMIGPVFGVVSELAERHALPYRIPYESFGPRSRVRAQLFTWLRSGGLAKGMLLAALWNLAAGAARHHRPIAYRGILDTGRMSLETWLQVLSSLGEGVTEVAVHPACSLRGERVTGYSEADYRFLSSKNRQMELDALLDPRLRNAFESHGVELVRFGDLCAAPAIERRAA